MKMTKDLRNQIDKNGHVIDFLFCFRCTRFLDMKDYEDGQEIICAYCHRGDKVG